MVNIKKRGRPGILDRYDVKDFILGQVREYLKQPLKNRAQIKVFNSELLDKISKHEWKPPLKKPPAESSLTRTVQVIMKSFSIKTGEDLPWTILSLSQYDISQEALPVVMAAWSYWLQNYPDDPLTISDARWIGRIYNFFPQSPDDEGELNLMVWMARHYSATEKALKTELIKYPENSEEALSLWHSDSELYHHEDQENVSLETHKILRKQIEKVMNQIGAKKIKKEEQKHGDQDVQD